MISTFLFSFMLWGQLWLLENSTVFHILIFVDNPMKKGADAVTESELLKAALEALSRRLDEGERVLTFDPVRDKTRYEIPAALLYGLCIIGAHQHSAALSCRNILLDNRNDQGLWDEMPYAREDESIGFYGLVPSAFAIMALAAYASCSKDNMDIPLLVAACDTIYTTENDGGLVKARHNRSNVLNTNLLAAQALLDVANLLPATSSRRSMYMGLVERVIRRTLGYQSPKGLFAYHFDCLAVPILYQAMVAAQLRRLLIHFEQPVLHLAVYNAIHGLKHFYNTNGLIAWNKANNHDKQGALWAYTFTLGALDHDDSLRSTVLHHLSGWRVDDLFVGTEGAQTPDPFYTAWMVFGLCWSLDVPRLAVSRRPGVLCKRAVLLLEYYRTALSYLDARRENSPPSGVITPKKTALHI